MLTDLLRFALTVLTVLIAMAPDVRAADQVVNVVYVNGIQNVGEDIDDAIARIEYILDESENHASKRTFRIVANPNPAGWFGKKTESSFEQDIMELFLLKTAEEKYAPFFPNIVVPHNDLTKSIFVPAAKAVKIFLDNMLPGGTILEERGWIAASDMNATQRAAKRLAEKVNELGQAVVVAHSQGNLLANLAYASLASEHGDLTKKMVRVLNVANNSRFSVNGLDFTHDGDAALTALQFLALTLNWTRNTADCTAPALCPFMLTDPTLTRSSGGGDAARHNFVDTYLSDHSVDVSNAAGVSFTPDKRRFRDRFEDFVYAAATSLDTVNPPPSEVPDQHNAAFLQTSFGIGLAQAEQGVTAGITGKLTAIELLFNVDVSQFYPGLTSGAIEVSITRGFPWISQPTVVATLVPTPGSPGVNRIDVRSFDLRFVEGEQFTIGVRGIGDPHTNFWQELLGTEYQNPSGSRDPFYPRGFLYFNGGPLRPDIGFDLGFRTFVEPSAAPPDPRVDPVALPFTYQGITFNHAFRYISKHDGVVHTCYFSTDGAEPKQSDIPYPFPFIGFESKAMYSPDESCGGTYLTLNTRLLKFFTSPPWCSDGTCGEALTCPLSTATWSSFQVRTPDSWTWLGTNICGQIYFPGDILYGAGGSPSFSAPLKLRGARPQAVGGGAGYSFSPRAVRQRTLPAISRQ